jgi:uncharacterized protein with PIN domain
MYEESPNKEKRIAFLSIFSSLCRTGQIDTKTAKEVVDTLFKEYPIEGTKPMYKPQSITNEDVCPDCGGVLKEKSGVKNGRAWSGAFCQNPNCKKVIWYPKQTRAQTIKSMGEDMMQDEANHPQFDDYGNPI